MPRAFKRIDVSRIIISLIIIPGFIISFFLSCEYFDYERVILIETGSVDNKSCNSAEITGQLLDLGESKVIQHGHCWSSDPDPTEDLITTVKLGPKASKGSFSSGITGLLPGTKYYIRAYATSSEGTTVYGDEKSFTTDPGYPPVARFAVSATAISAGQSVQLFDLSANAPTSRTWSFGDGETSTLQNPVHTYATTGNYTVELQVYNECGEGSSVKPDYIKVQETFTDSRDGHEYRWVRIGEQVWMAENLAYLPEVYPPTDYSEDNGLKYVYDYYGYDTDEAKATFNYSTYGVLYNWMAAKGGNPASIKGECPDGWHLPSDYEWFDLIYYLGDNWEEPFNTNAGGQLKEVEFFHWIEPNMGATNTSGFTGLPGGGHFSDFNGYFDYLGSDAFWWSSDEDTTGYSWGLTTYDENIHWYYSDKSNGNSVRCVKDGGSLKKQMSKASGIKPTILNRKR